VVEGVSFVKALGVERFHVLQEVITCERTRIVSGTGNPMNAD
jgi:hypothetical protein